MTRLSLGQVLAGRSLAGRSLAGRKLLGLWTLMATALAGALWLASSPWLRAVEVPGGAWLLAVAAAVPVTVALVSSRALRLPVMATALAQLGLMALALVASDHFDLHAAWTGLDHVPSQLLTETLPLSGHTYLLAAPFVLTWLAAASSAELAARPSCPSSTTFLAPLAYLALDIAVTSGAPTGHTVAEAASALGALAVCALARQGIVDACRSRVAEQGYVPGIASPASDHHHFNVPVLHAAAGALAAGCLVVALALVVPTIPAVASKPSALSRTTPLHMGTVVDPLDVFASMRDSSPGKAPTTIFTVHISGPWNGYLGVADLTSYNGGSWAFDATFRPTGGRVPAADHGADATATSLGRAVAQRYDIMRSSGLPLLPAIDRPQQVRGTSVDVDPVTGMIAASPHLPAHYSVVSRAPVTTLSGMPTSLSLASGTQVPGDAGQALTSLPAGSAKAMAAAVRFAVNVTGLPSSRSVLFCQLLASGMRTHERRVVPRPAQAGQGTPAALAGTSLAQVINAVTVDRAATPEQFATFYAAVLRYLGIPARLVTGFRAPAASVASGTAGGLPGGTYRLTNRDAWTWVEVPVVGEGWVIVDPTPSATTNAPAPPPEQVRPTPTTVPKQATAVPGHNGAAHAVAKPVNVQIAGPASGRWAAWSTLGGVVLVVTLLLGVIGVPAARRRLRRLARHRTDDPRLLAAGAWLELLDGLSRSGLHVEPSATSVQVAVAVAARFGEEHGPITREVGTVAERAIFSASYPLDVPTAQVAWQQQRRLYRRLSRSLPPGERARALVRVGDAPHHPEAYHQRARRSRP